jgi:hypothetical protein
MSKTALMVIGAALGTCVACGAQDYEQEIVEVNFSGGPLVEFVDTVEEAFPEVSIVLMPGTHQFEVPEIHARLGDPFTALELIDGLEGHLFFPATEHANQRHAKGVITSHLLDDNLVRITADIRSFVASSQPTVSIRVFPVEDLFRTGMDMEMILGTIQVGLELLDVEMPNVRFHEPTNIIFVKGTRQTIDCINDSLDALREVGQVRENSPADTTLQAQLTALQAAYKELQQRLIELQDNTATKE